MSSQHPSPSLHLQSFYGRGKAPQHCHHEEDQRRHQRVWRHERRVKGTVEGKAVRGVTLSGEVVAWEREGWGGEGMTSHSCASSLENAVTVAVQCCLAPCHPSVDGC
ncbi:hypothetical protein E2C01_040723 [Portunus trituberculatus]|uniref:Uncharacterized protein n=1 Tax=Portunus trituberculatus TaxID=210409 RepID=A0A5B7FNZ6_PORTR|nr:hypothetical protein [Portunus trituberculatus]